MKSSIIKRTIVVDGRKTSISVENSFWFGLNEIAADSGVPVSGLTGAIKAHQVDGRTFTSSARVYVLTHFMERLKAFDGIGCKNAPQATAPMSDY